MNETTIIPIDRLEFGLTDWRWPFQRDSRAQISAHFDDLRREKPALWNGRVFLLHDYEISKAVMRGNYFESDFATLIAWRDWGFQDKSIYTCFAMAAVETACGGFLVGVMGEHTANPGKTYFPTGTPDIDDLNGQHINLDTSVRRELAEETGLDVAEFQIEAGWHAVFSDRHIALMKRMRSSDSAEAIRARVLNFLAQEQQPEFSEIRFLYGKDDITSAVPVYVQAYLEHIWRNPRA
jgi:8-oxo-dGTP pyrophosphatase MutT (NUDIX family)